MASMQDCIGKRVAIGPSSITIKGDNGKTCGVVRNIRRLKEVQYNKQIDYYRVLKNAGAWCCDGIDINRFVIDLSGKMYYLRNVHSKQFYEKYGFFNDAEREQFEKVEEVVAKLKEKIEVIDCYA